MVYWYVNLRHLLLMAQAFNVGPSWYVTPRASMMEHLAMTRCDQYVNRTVRQVPYTLAVSHR
jgi:hypothetical protein